MLHPMRCVWIRCNLSKSEISLKNTDFWDKIYYTNNEKKVQVNTTSE